MIFSKMKFKVLILSILMLLVYQVQASDTCQSVFDEVQGVTTEKCRVELSNASVDVVTKKTATGEVQRKYLLFQLFDVKECVDYEHCKIKVDYRLNDQLQVEQQAELWYYQSYNCKGYLVVPLYSQAEDRQDFFKNKHISSIQFQQKQKRWRIELTEKQAEQLQQYL